MKHLFIVLILFPFVEKKTRTGVTNVETSVEQKSVIVTSEDFVSSEEILQKLNKWSEASGKYVKLA